MASSLINWLDLLEKCTTGRDRRYPVYARIKDRIRESIESGLLSDNDRLPADRELASMLGVDRSTIARAYDELQAEGLVQSGVGRGTFVTKNQDRVKLDNQSFLPGRAESQDFDFPTRPVARRSNSNQILWSEKFSRFSQSVSSFMAKQPAASTNTGVISFAAGVPSFEFVPQADFESILSELASTPGTAFAYTATEGEETLRQEIRKHLSESGMQVKDEELLVLSGSQQGIDLVTRTFVDPQDFVAIEDPTYFWALCNFTAFGARTLPVAVGEQGIRLDLLEGMLSRRRVKLLYVMPSFQNPTGATMPADHRRALLDLARDYEVPVFEDNFVGDLNYDAEQPVPLRSMPGGEDLVIHQSTLSKSLCPGLRIGWMVAPAEARSRLLMSKRVSDLSTNSVSQAIVAEYLRRGLYSKHLQSIRQAYRSRRDCMTKAMASMLPQELRWSTPSGGMFIWVKLPDGLSARELLSYAERESVIFSPGDLFFNSGNGHEYFRLSFVQNSEDVIAEGVEKLARAVRTYLGRSRQRQSVDGVDLRSGPSVFV